MSWGNRVKYVSRRTATLGCPGEDFLYDFKGRLAALAADQDPPRLHHRDPGAPANAGGAIGSDETQELGHDARPLILSQGAEELLSAEQREGPY